MAWKTLQVVIALATVVLMADVAHAKTQTWIMGPGHGSCGALIAAAGNTPPGEHKQINMPSGVFIDEYAEYQGWLMGFVSGFNAAHGDDDEQQVKGTDIAGMDLWMRNWCNQHPTETVFDAASAFVNEMLTNAASHH
jgi:hypothetical protein